MSATATKPREVSLQVCECCGLIGKRAYHEGTYNGYCTGPIKEPHQRTRMIVKRFREIAELEMAV